jgi:hypothetical protein
VSTGISGVGVVEAGENCGSDFARLVAAQREANDLVLASSEIAFSAEVFVARRDVEGLMLNRSLTPDSKVEVHHRVGTYLAEGPTSQPCVSRTAPPPERLPARVHARHSGLRPPGLLHGSQAPYRARFHGRVQRETQTTRT